MAAPKGNRNALGNRGNRSHAPRAPGAGRKALALNERKPRSSGKVPIWLGPHAVLQLLELQSRRGFGGDALVEALIAEAHAPAITAALDALERAIDATKAGSVSYREAQALLHRATLLCGRIEEEVADTAKDAPED